MKKTIQRILITVLVFSFILVPTSKVEAAKYPYTDYGFGPIGNTDTYVGHTIAVLHSGAPYGSSCIKSLKVKNPKIASVKVDGNYIVVTGKKVGKTTATITYKDTKKVSFGSHKQTADIEVFPNYISKSVRVRGKKISIGESLAQVKKDFGTKFKVIKDKGMKGKYLAYTDDMSKFLVVGICKDKVVEIYTSSSDWKSGNIGFGVKNSGKKYKSFTGEVDYFKAVFTDYRRVSSGVDKYMLDNPLKFITHRADSCSTLLEDKPRIYYSYYAGASHSFYDIKEDSFTSSKIYDLIKRGAKAAAKSKGFTISNLE